MITIGFRIRPRPDGAPILTESMVIQGGVDNTAVSLLAQRFAKTYLESYALPTRNEILFTCGMAFYAWTSGGERVPLQTMSLEFFSKRG